MGDGLQDMSLSGIKFRDAIGLVMREGGLGEVFGRAVIPDRLLPDLLTSIGRPIGYMTENTVNNITIGHEFLHRRVSAWECCRRKMGVREG